MHPLKRLSPHLFIALFATLPGTLTLDDALRIAREQSFKIAEAQERLRAQQHAATEARAGFYPSVDLTGTFDQTDQNRLPTFNGQQFGSESNWSVDLRASNTIYAGGRDSAATRRAALLERAAQYDLHIATQDVMLEVQTRFYAALLAAAQVEVQEQTTQLLEEDISAERKRLAAGSVSDFNVLRAEVALANSRTPLIRAKNEFALAKEELRRSLGVVADYSVDAVADFEVAGALSEPHYTITLAEALSRAEQHRSELKRQQLRIEAEAAGIEIAEAERVPSLGVYAGVGSDKSRFSDSLSEEEHGWNAGVETRWNLFNGYRTSAQIAAARSGESIARISQSDERQRIALEVRREYLRLQEARALVTASTKVVQQAEESLRLARARTAAGAAVQLDVLDTQVALTEAKTNRIRALYDYNIAVARMRRAVGE